MQYKKLLYLVGVTLIVPILLTASFVAEGYSPLLKYECEETEVSSASTSYRLNNNANTKMSGLYGLMSPISSVGQHIELSISVEKSGLYNVKICSLNNYNRGIFEVSINGVFYGDPFDFYSPVEEAKIYDLGYINIEANDDLKIRFTAINKNPSSSSYNITLDYIQLMPNTRELPLSMLKLAEVRESLLDRIMENTNEIVIPTVPTDNIHKRSDNPVVHVAPAVRLQNAVVMFVGSSKMFIQNRSEKVNDNPQIVPIIRDDRTLVPLSIVQKLDGEVSYFDYSGRIELVLGNNIVEMYLNNCEYIKNGERKRFDTPPIEHNGAIMIPLHVVADAAERKTFFYNNLIIVSDIENIFDIQTELEQIKLLIKKILKEEEL